MSSVALLPNALADLFATASETQRLTLADRYGLMAAMLTESLDEEERRAIDRLLRGVVRGRIRLTSEISAVIR